VLAVRLDYLSWGKHGEAAQPDHDAGRPQVRAWRANSKRNRSKWPPFPK
jgi:hypothetical protein